MSVDVAPSVPAEASLSLPGRLARFIGERFPLQVHGLSIVFFFLTNAAVAQAATKADAAIAFGPRSLVAALALGLMFLRLRLFDEVKDYRYDLQHNPGRPLPRGLLTVAQVNAWAGATAASEAILAGALGLGAFTGFLAVLVFTLLMRFEFFIRDLIRPRLLTYALLHTPSGGLIGLFVFCAVTGRPIWDVPRAMWLYAFAGWSLLMVFEVARKTYDPKAEPGSDTYSSVFGVKGAMWLNAIFVFGSTLLIILAVLDSLRIPLESFGFMMWGLTGVVLAVVARYGMAPSPTTAKHLRIAASVYLALASLLAAGAIVAVRGALWTAGA
jgi:4-hydroxybenzoate polyprenyltransferase